MLCGISHLKRLFRRRSRNRSSNVIGDTSQNTNDTHNSSPKPPSLKEEAEEAKEVEEVNRFSALSEIACAAPVENPKEENLYRKHFLEDRDRK